MHASPGGKGAKLCGACYTRWRNLGKPDELPLARGRAWKAASPGRPERGTCLCCKRPGMRLHNVGWCGACYSHWLRLGKPDELPARQVRAAAPRARQAEAREARLADLRFLMEQGVTRTADLAARMGVTREMVRHYFRWLREEEG